MKANLINTWKEWGVIVFTPMVAIDFEEKSFKMANKMQRYEKEMKLFEPESNLEILSQVPIRPKAGYQYIYKWDSTTRRKDWRADGYRFENLVIL